MKYIYLDHNATTPLHPDVLEAMMPYLKEKYGNPSSVHLMGREAREALERSREAVGDFLGTEHVDIIFTAGGTESDNMAIKGVAYKNKERGNHIITSQVEHHAVLNAVRALEKEGFKATYLGVDKLGRVSVDEVKNAITDKTILITIMHANNEVGTIQPIEEIGALARERKLYFHTDAIQTVGKLTTNVEELHVDLLSLSAHKFYGPKGVGALYIRKGTKLAPLIHGGHHERLFRPGTENVAGIVGLAAALEIAKKNMDEERTNLLRLKKMLYEGFKARLSHVHLNGDLENSLPNTLNIAFEFVEGESILLNLDMKGICAATGSACTSGSLEPSHVLTAMGVAPEISQGSIRFSLGAGNSEEEINYCLETIPPIIKRLREMSPLYNKSDQ